MRIIPIHGHRRDSLDDEEEEDEVVERTCRTASTKTNFHKLKSPNKMMIS